MVSRENGRAGRLPLAVFAGWLAGAGLVSGATFPLAHCTDGAEADFRLPLGKSEVRFKKEPDYVGAEIVRSVLYVAPDKKEYMGFACDTEGGALYFDLNRNLDLTDDPEGVFKAGGKSGGHSFENVVLPIQQGGRRRDLVLEVQIYGERWGRYSVQSSWKSDAVSIGGGRYQVSVVDDGDGVITDDDSLFLEPAEEEFSPGGDDPKVELRAPATLVLKGSSFALSYELSDDGKTLALSVEPGADKLVEVALEGRGIARIAMQDGATAAVDFGPGAVLLIPAGRYRGSVWARAGDGERASLWRAGNVSHRVREGAGRESWRIGGPIVSKLTCQQAGGRLSFDQATVGAGGEKYSRVDSSGVSLGKPKLRVKKAGEIVHVGEFEYG